MNLFGITQTQIVYDIWFVVKLMFLLGMAFYIVFALVVVRQVWHMTSTLKVGFELPIKTMAILHLVLSIFLLIFSLVVL